MFRLKSLNKFNKVIGIVGILFISIMMFNSVNVNAKSQALDYFTVEGAYDYVNYACAEGDYLYILNNTKLLKISLETSLVVDYIEYPLLSSVTEFARKGQRIYFDAFIDGANTIVCIDIATFSELAQVFRAELTPNYLRGIVNTEYYDCNGHDFWVWAYSHAGTSSDPKKYPSVLRGEYDAGSVEYEWCVILGHVYVGTTTGNHLVYQYRYNATSDSVSSIWWNDGATSDHSSYYYYASIYFNHTSNAWESSTSADIRKYQGGGSQLSHGYDGYCNIQHEFDGVDLVGGWGEWGVRQTPSVDSSPSIYSGLNNKGEVSLDIDDRMLYYWWEIGSYGREGINIARFDKGSGWVGVWRTPNLLNKTRFYNNGIFGFMALGKYNDADGIKKYWVGYSNKDDEPRAERVIEVNGVDCVESGTVLNEYSDPTWSKVYKTSKNIIAIFRNGTDVTNLYVCRNLIDRDLLESGGYITPTLQFIDATLYTMVGNERVLNDGWLFMGEIYQLESTIANMTYYYLELDDGENTLKFYYNNDTKSLNMTESEQFLGGLIDSSIETVNETLEQYLCTWTFILNRNIVDTQNISISYYGYNALERHEISDVAITGLHIYNLGGLTYYEFVGDGGRTAQGSPFELYATNGSLSSSAKAEQIFRKLQSVHFLMELDMSNEWEDGNGIFDIDAGVGYVDIGFDYRLDGSWIEGFRISLYVQDADVGHHNLGTDNDWIKWSADFYNYDPYYGAVINLKSQLIYSNHWGYDGENLDPDHHINRTSTQLWIDLWFDRTNASTTIATQINSYYHGMKEHGSAWWFGYGKFQPMISDYDNAKFLDDLYDEDGEISNCQKIELVKFWIKVGKVDIPDGNDEKWIIRGIEDMNREQAIDRMMGIDEPTFVQTKVLDMPQTGFINALKTAINNLSVTIWLGALQFIKILMSSIGYLMNAIGLGVWWESFSIMLGNIATASLSFMDDLTIALLNSALLIEQITRLITNGVTRYVYVITAFITSIIAWYGYIIQMFSGGGIFNINIWTSLNLEDIFILLMHLSPVWWINRLNESDHFIETLQGDLRFIIMLVTGLFNFLTSVIIVTMTLINILLGMLPI